VGLATNPGVAADRPMIVQTRRQRLESKRRKLSIERERCPSQGDGIGQSLAGKLALAPRAFRAGFVGL